MRKPPIAPTTQMLLGQQFADQFVEGVKQTMRKLGRVAENPDRASVDLLAQGMGEFIRRGLAAQDAVDRILAENERVSGASNPAGWAAQKRTRRRGR